MVKTFTALWDSVKTGKSVGTLYIDNPPGAAFADPLAGMPPALRKAGYSESSGGFFKVATDDFSNQIASFKKGNADIVSGFMYESHFATFWKQAQQQGYKPEVCTVAAAFLFPSALKALGAAGNGMSTEVWWTPSFPYRSFADATRALPSWRPSGRSPPATSGRSRWATCTPCGK